MVASRGLVMVASRKAIFPEERNTPPLFTYLFFLLEDLSWWLPEDL